MWKSAAHRLLPQFSRYASAGIVGTGVHFAVLYLLAEHSGAVAASTAGAVSGCLVNFSINYALVFERPGPLLAALPKFVSVAAAGILVNAILMLVLAPLLPLPVAQLAATATVCLLSFPLNRQWSFVNG
jgi:putative flippase GtrA